jgi:spore germination protein KB
MDKKQHLSPRQFAWMIGTMLITGSLIITPSKAAYVSGIDAWFTYYLPIFYALFIALFFYYLIQQFPGKNLFQIIHLVLGRFVSFIFIGLFVFYAWIVLMRDVRLLSILFKNSLLPRTPEAMIILIFILVLIYFGRSSVENAARVNDMVFPVFILMVLSFPLILANELSVLQIEPMLVEGVRKVLGASLLNLPWFGDIFLAGAFLHTVTHSQKALSAMRHGIFFTAFVLTLLVFLCLTVLGERVTGQSVFPFYTLIQQIHLTDFLDRVDVIVFSVWLPVATIKTVFFYLAALTAINHLSSKPAYEYRMINFSFGLFLFVSSFLGFKGMTDIVQLGTHGALGLTLAIQPIFCILLFTAIKLKQTNKDMKKPSKSLGRWRMGTNLLLLLCFLFISTGMIYALHFPKVASIASIGYACCLTGAVLTSYKELKTDIKKPNQT